MRIAFIVSSLPLPPVCGGAVELLTDYLLQASEQSGRHDITVYSPWTAEAERAAAAYPHTRFDYVRTGTLAYRMRRRIYKIFARGGYYSHYEEYYLGRVLRLMRGRQYDAVVVENRPGYALRLKAAGYAVVCHLHNDYINADLPQSAAAATACRKIICVSDYLRLRAEGAGAGVNAVTVHNGIDLTAFRSLESEGHAQPQSSGSGSENEPPAQTMSRAARARYGFRADDFIVVFSGRLIAGKGVAELLEAIRLLESHADIRLMIIGGRGQAWDAAGLGEKVVFTGWMDRSAIPAHLAMADICVVPTTTHIEGFPTVCLEALAAGLPIIATTSGGTPETVSADCSITVGTPAGAAGAVAGGPELSREIADAILRLHDDEALRRRMADAAKARAPQFSREAYVKHWWREIETI